MTETNKQTSNPLTEFKKPIIFNYPLIINEEDITEIKGYRHSTLGTITEDNIKEAINEMTSRSLLDFNKVHGITLDKLLSEFLTKAILITDTYEKEHHIKENKLCIIDITPLTNELKELEEDVIIKSKISDVSYFSFIHEKEKRKDLKKIVNDLRNEDLFSFETETYFTINSENRKKLINAVKEENNLSEVTKGDILDYMLEHDFFITAVDSFEREVNTDVNSVEDLAEEVEY